MLLRLSRLFIFLFAVAVVSCDDNDEKPKGKYESGVLVVNEGGFGASNGSVTWYDDQNNAALQNIITAPGSNFAGDVVQSLTFDGDKGYLVVNDDNKIEVFDGKQLTSLETITHTDIVKPRYMKVINGKAYISVWGPYDDNYFLIDSYVLVYDLATHTVVEKINTDEGTENLLYNGNYLFATNYNFGSSNTLAVIDPADNSLVDQIELSAGPSGMVLDKNNKLWVITTGTYQGNNGQLFRINPANLQIEETIELGLNPGSDLAVSADKESLLFSAGNLIYKMPITATETPSTPLIDNSSISSLYAFDVNPETDEIYLGDAVDYASPGMVYVHSSSGVLKNSFSAGISPTQFIFR